MNDNVLAELVGTLPELIVLLAVAWFLFRNGKFLREVLQSIRNRLNAGAPVKIANIIELGNISSTLPANVPQDALSAANISPGVQVLPGVPDHDKFFESTRNEYLRNYKNFHIIHSARPTPAFVIDDKGISWRIYDVVIYIYPYWGVSLTSVESVDYYFGPGWNNRVFKIVDRYNGFAIKTIASGEFECIARLNLVDKKQEPIVLFKFIDRQMPSLAQGEAQAGGRER